MKTAYDRGHEKGLESLKGAVPPVPHHYNEKEQGEWLEGFCVGYLEKYYPVVLAPNEWE